MYPAPSPVVIIPSLNLPYGNPNRNPQTPMKGTVELSEKHEELTFCFQGQMEGGYQKPRVAGSLCSYSILYHPVLYHTILSHAISTIYHTIPLVFWRILMFMWSLWAGSGKWQ